MFRDNIVRLRKSRGLTQVGFAKALHVTQSAVSHWESGRSIPDAIQMSRIAEYFGVTVDDLIVDVPREPQMPVRTEPSPQPAKPLPPPDSIQEYLARLTPENRAFIEQMARKLLESQQPDK